MFPVMRSNKRCATATFFRPAIFADPIAFGPCCSDAASNGVYQYMAKRRGKRPKARSSTFVDQIIAAYHSVQRERLKAPAKLSKAARRRLKREQDERDYREYHIGETVRLLRPRV